MDVSLSLRPIVSMHLVVSPKSQSRLTAVFLRNTNQLPVIHRLLHLLDPSLATPSLLLQTHPQAPPQMADPHSLCLARLPPRRRILAVRALPSLCLPLPHAPISLPWALRCRQLLEHFCEHSFLFSIFLGFGCF